MVESNSKSKQAQKYLKAAEYALKTGVFKWSKDYDEASINYERAAKLFKELNDDKGAADAYLKFAQINEHQKQYHMAGDGYAEAAKFLPDNKWQTSLQYLKQADMYYKMSGYDDRGFTLIKRFAQNLIDSENQDSVNAGLKILKELWPQLFEGDMMTMNYDLIESYIKLLAKQSAWKDLISAKQTLMKYYRDTKQVDHRTRRSYLEIICAQVLLEDFYRLEDTMDQFCKEVGGNPYTFDEYEICMGVKESAEKKDWESMKVWLRKPLFGFIEIEIVKAIKKWVLEQPVAVSDLVQATAGNIDAEQKALDDLLC